jgi:predicted acylesterase/phospholipase RssA
MGKTPSEPSRLCDMVMKGGITSGIVYPLAAVKLSECFRFKNIGGTSAGAIAAAATAVAELTRDKGGFERLKQLPEFLSGQAPDGSGNNLLAFFQPQRGTAPLFRLCVAGLGGGGRAIVSICGRIFVEFFPAILIGAFPATSFLILSSLHATGSFRILCFVVGIFLAIIGVSLAVGGHLLIKASRALPRNFYGLCSGMTDDGDGTHPPRNKGKPLTVWLNEYLNEFLGRTAAQEPLIFGELWGDKPDSERVVDLEMMTTCLTHGRPYRLPFRDDAEVRENRFYFCADEFRRLFPANVVDWMIAHPREVSDSSEGTRIRREKLKECGFYPLPAPAALPVVVAVRMSLSFPILLSAIPLYDVDRSRDPKGDRLPERCWFSDGGVCSNFPLHFFDSPFPRWPTFGIDLRELPAGTSPAQFLRPRMVKNNSEGIQENWNRFEVVEQIDQEPREKSGLGKLSGFAGAFITTMQNWSDNTLSRLPGYRDRVRPVPLTPEEGGLNLNMPKERIDALTARGVAAGDELIARFSASATEPSMNWNNHRWIRMRSSLASLETMLQQIDHACAQPQAGDVDFESWVAATPPGIFPGYKWERPQQGIALRMIKSIREIVADCEKVGVNVSDGSPRPRGELRRRAHI